MYWPAHMSVSIGSPTIWRVADDSRVGAYRFSSSADISVTNGVGPSVSSGAGVVS